MKRIFFTIGLLFSLNLQAAILVPAYFYPSSDPNQSYWDEMTTAAQSGAKITAIMNPNSGPGLAVNSDYINAVNAFRAVGGQVIGYVSTNYGNRNQADVLSDIAQYASTYTIDGIFLDEMSNQADKLVFYQTLKSSIDSINPTYQVFGNAGTNTLEAYMATADVIVTFENRTGYETYTPDTWVTNYSADRFAHLMYDVATEAQMLLYLDLAKSRNVGYVYVTDDNLINPNSLNNPWDTLPSYWTKEVAVSAVPLPNALILMVSGLMMLLFFNFGLGNRVKQIVNV